MDFERKPFDEDDLPIETRIRNDIRDFDEVANTINVDNKPDIVEKLRARRNIIKKNMTVYLSHFENQEIMDNFTKKLEEAKNNAVENGKRSKYLQFLNEIEVVGIFLGMKDNIAEKRAKQFYKKMKECNQ